MRGTDNSRMWDLEICFKGLYRSCHETLFQKIQKEMGHIMIINMPKTHFQNIKTGNINPGTIIGL